MTDQRFPRDSYLGHAGRLSLRPLELVTKAEDCVWQSSRDHSQHGLSVKRLSAAKQPKTADAFETIQDSHHDSWGVSKRQRAWLGKNHPEALLGEVEPTRRLLSEVNSPHNDFKTTLSTQPLVAVGELPDFTEPTAPKVAPLLAEVTGSDRSAIRLTAMTQDTWQCSADENIFALPTNLDGFTSIVISPAVGPVRSLKCVVDVKPYDSLRILLAQWDMETRLFVPEIRKTALNTGLDLDSMTPRVNTNCAIKITRKDTGGRNHQDVAFNCGTKLKQPQLALIDDQGCWTVWDLPGLRARTSRRLKAKLSCRGNLEHGVSDEPRTLSYSPQWHAIAWVGPTDGAIADLDESDYEDDLGKAFPVNSFLTHSTSLLLCNAKSVKVFDLNKESFLPALSLTSTDPFDRILETQVHSNDSSYVFVVTTRSVFVLRLTNVVSQDFTKPNKGWFVLSCLPHFRSPLSDTVRLSVTVAPKIAGKRGFLLLLYAKDSEWMDLLCLTVRKQDPLHLDWRREAMSCLPEVQCAWLQPVAAGFGAAKPQTVLARGVAAGHDRFYQLFEARKSSDVQQSLLLISTNFPQAQRQPNFSRLDSAPQEVKKTTKSSRRVATRFVVPENEVSTQNDASSKAHASHLTQGPADLIPLARFLDPFVNYLQMPAAPVTENQQTPPNPFDPVHEQIEDAAAADSLPASTVLELIKDFQTPADMSVATDEWNTEIELLKHSDSRIRNLDLQRPDSNIGRAASLHELVGNLQNLTGDESTAHLLPKDTDQERPDTIRKIACDLYLSSIGFHLAATNEQDLQNSDLPPAFQSQSQVVEGGSQLANATRSLQYEPGSSHMVIGGDEEDPAMKLIRSYTATGRFMTKKETELGSLWKTGTDPHEYVFDLDKEREVTEGMQRREKKLAKASRKRQRTEALMQLQARKGCDDLPATQPPPEISYAQSSPVRQQYSQDAPKSFFSQGLSQPVTMSQPITGPFAQRPKKKVKRKGGF
ncbi:RNA polymerase I-specific transcription initiation factor RRN6 [Microdochium nivale]|nr:RNA polymerase I-specific transcription initiation factor RRN6 [Microdochium nivale]